MTELLDIGDGRRLAYRHRRGRTPTLVFLPGYMSDMEGGKATALDAWAQREGRAMLRFDYAGCGASDGRFEEQSVHGRLPVIAVRAKIRQIPLLRLGLREVLGGIDRAI